MLTRAWKIAYFHDFCQCIWSRKAKFRQQMLPKIIFYKNTCLRLSNALPSVSFGCFDRYQLQCKVKVKWCIFYFLQKMHFFAIFLKKSQIWEIFCNSKFSNDDSMSFCRKLMIECAFESWDHQLFVEKKFRQHLRNICCLKCCLNIA